jgi:hypothetical protein
MAVSATLHCLTGCAIGEILGMVIATAVGLGNAASIIIAILLAFLFGYGLTVRSLIGAVGLRQATRLAFPLTRFRSRQWRSSTTSSLSRSQARSPRAWATACSGGA